MANQLFDNLQDLLTSICNDSVTFKDKDSKRITINAICDGLFERNTLYEELKTYGDAEDLDEYFYENWADGYDWFDVMTFNFDTKDLSVSVLTEGDLHRHYSKEEAEDLLSLTVSNWYRATKRYVLDNI